MKEQTNKTKKRIIAMLLIFTLTFGNFGLVGRWSYAAGLEFFKSTEYQFNAFFADQKDASTLNIKQDVNSSAIMNIDIGISGDGYIKDGTLEILGKDGSTNLSYTAEATFGDYDKVKQTTTSENQNQVNANTISNETSNTTTNNVVNSTISNETVNTVVNTVSNEVQTNTTNEITNTVENNEAQNEVVNTVSNNVVSNEIVNTVSNNVVSNEVTNQVTNSTDSNTVITNTISAGNALELGYETKIFENNKIKLDQINASTKMYLTFKYISSDFVYSNAGDVLKFTGIYVDKDLKEHTIEKTVDFSINWITKQNIQVTNELTKYIPYNIGEKSGVILQEKIVVNKEGDILVPADKTTIETNIPTIAGILPVSVDVVPTSVKGTTGKEVSEISDTDFVWAYQKETQTLKIETNNNLSSNKAWAGKGYDEYLVIYQYDIKIEEISEENRFIENIIKVQNKLCNGEETNKEITNKINLQGQIGDIVSWNIRSLDTTVNKGKMLANYNTENVYETEMKSKVEVNISSSELVNQIVLRNADTNFVTSSGELLPTGSTYYKEIIIKRDNLSSIIGEEGSIEILSETGDVLCTINSQTQVDENGEYVIRFEEPIRSVFIQTSKITGAGVLEIEITRGIKTNEYDKATIKDIKAIEENIEIFAKYLDKEEAEKIGDSKIVTQLENAKTQATLELSTNEIPTSSKIENVEMRVELNNNKETSDMYENGTFLIVFPKTIKEVQVNNAGILYGDEFQYTTAEQITIDEQTAIKLEIEGKQNGFNTVNLSNGTNLVLNMDIKADVYAPNKTEKIELFYINSDVSEYQASTEMNGGIVGYDVKQIKIVSGNGLVNITTVSEHEETKEEIAIRGEKKTLELGAYEDQKSAEMKITLINNEKEAVEDVKVLGRIPFENNKSILTNESLGSTFTANMTQPISLDGAENAKIYYSEKEDATEDLANGENEWTTEVEDYSKVKSYLVDLKEAIINPEDVVDIKYNVAIPANLEYDEESIATHKLFYNVKGSAMEETYTSIALATPEGPSLEITMDVDAGDGAVVHEKERLKYIIKVKNTSDYELNNVVVTIPVPEGTIYLERTEDISNITLVRNYDVFEKIYTYEKINPNSEIELEMYVDIGIIVNNLESIKASAYVKSDEYTEAIKSNIIINDVKTAEITVDNAVSCYDTKILNPGDEIYYSLIIKNRIDNQINNMILTSTIPNELELQKIEILDDTTLTYIEIPMSNIECNKETGVLKCKLGNIDFNEINIRVYVKVNKLDKIENNRFNVSFYITGDNIDQYRSNTIELNACIPQIKMEKYYSDESNVIHEGDMIEYYTIITNVGNCDYLNGTVTEIVPSIFKDISIVAVNSKNNEEIEIYNPYEFSVEKGENLKIKVMATVGNLPEDINNSINVSAYATISKESYDDIVSNDLTYIFNMESEIEETPPIIYPEETPNNTPTVEPTIVPSSEPTNTPSIAPTITPTEKPTVTVNPTATPTINVTPTPTQTGNNNVVEKTYKIIGTAWLDDNKDGIKDSNEKPLGGITVKLVNVSTNSFEKDNNGNYIKTTTAGDGTYTLEGMKAGKYIVVFEYDTGKYSVTKYKVSGVAENKNSNVATSKIEIDGKESSVAVSDIIEITNENIGDIDIGLIKNSILEFKIEKTVKKITVSTHKGTETKDYNNVSLAKTEIHAKEIAGAKVTIDYEIKISNIGEVPGSISEVIDYIPAGTELVEKNGWTKKNNNQVVNTSLKNETLLADESTTLNISVTKNMTETNTGVVENKAELGNISTTSSNETITINESEVAKANVIITIKTGIQPMYVIIAVIASLMIVGIGIKIYKGKNK